MSTTPLAVRDAIIAKLKSVFPAPVLNQVEARETPIDAEALDWKGANPPAAFVLCAGLPESELQGGIGNVAGHFVVYVATKDAPQLSRGSGALVIVAKLMAMLLAGERWELCTNRAAHIEAINVTKVKTERSNVALWVVSWSQRFDLDPVAVEGEVDALLGVDVTLKQAGTDVGTQVINLEQP